MKIISLNTWMGVILEPLLEFFERNKEVDIFCLQEIYKDAENKELEPHPEPIKLDLFEQIENKLKETHVGYFRPAHKDFYGQAFFIKKGLVVKEEGDITIYENRETVPRGVHNRNLQYLKTNFLDHTLLVANVHGLWNDNGKTDTDDRIEQSLRIKSFIEKHDGLVVLVGDFNLNPDTESLAKIESGMRNLIKEYNITSTRTNLYKKENKFADYAIVSPNLTVKEFKVLPDEVSDHSPLYLEI